MILQELCKLYDRLAEDPEYTIPRIGYSLQKISFIIVLKPDGTLFDIHDARIDSNKKKIPRELLVPGGAKPSGAGINPCTLWDNTSYLLGFYDPKADKKTGKIKPDEQKKVKRAIPAYQESQKHHISLKETIPDPAFQAVVHFFESWNPEEISEEIKKKLCDFAGTGFGVFQIQGETRFVHEIPSISHYLTQNTKTNSYKERKQMCLITGDFCTPTATHDPAIKGVPGAQSSGAKVVSFNCKSFESYAREQGENAPVSELAANHYCVALNALLSSDKHKIRICKDTIVFWTEKRTKTEDLLSWVMDPPKEDTVPAQDMARLDQVKNFMKGLRNTGAPALGDFANEAGTHFFILGLAPNAARLSIRFWHAGTLGDFAEKLRAHHKALQIQRRFDNDPEFIPIWQILRQTARDSDGIPPLLGGALMRSILEGSNYPTELIQLIINRIKADGDISYIRVATVKAFLTKNKNKKITMSLDTTNTNPAYCLGRLFAVLEKTQADAIGPNAGIRERFYSAASATPASVFPIILRTFPHHVAKLEKGRGIFYDKLVQEIINGLDAKTFPKHLNLELQGMFAIGYYHQMQAFFTKKEATLAESTEKISQSK